jgi:tRNA (guanine-N7-)-methyltransferase
MRSNPQAGEELLTRRHLLLTPTPEEPVDPRTVFEGNPPVYLELGMGRGRFLLHMAQCHPEAAFIGVEMLKEVLVRAVRRADELELTNCRFVWDRIRKLDQWFPTGSISGIYLNFSDPWPKDRHGKRRLTHADYLEQYRRLLAPEGFVQFRTDNRALFEFSINAFLESGYRVSKVRLDWHRHPESMGAPRTEYEEKFGAAGHPIYQLEARPIR